MFTLLLFFFHIIFQIYWILINFIFFVSKFSKALAGQSNKDGKLTGTGEIKYKNAKNQITDDDFEECIVTKDSDNYKFDKFAEALQDIVIEDSFEKMQNDFCEKYYKVFEEKDENKLEYTKIFNEYTKTTEEFLEKELEKRVKEYQVDEFYKLLESKKFKIDEQLLDTLLDLSEFNNFKEMMLNYKREKENIKDKIEFGIQVQKAPVNKQGKNIDNFDFLEKNFKNQKK